MKNWKSSFRAIWIAEFIAIAGFATSTPIIAFYLESLGLSDPSSLKFWTGLTQTGASLAMAIFAPIWGSLADSYGRKLMLMRAMFGGALLIGLLSLTTEPWQVALLRTIQGCVTGTVAAANVYTASIVPREEAGYRLGLMQMGVYLGNSIGPLFGGIMARRLGYRVNFAVTAVLLLAAGTVILKFAREEFKPFPRSGNPLRNALPDLSILVRTPALLPLILVIFLFQFAGSVVSPMLPLFIRDMLGGSADAGSIAGAVLAATGAAGALGAVGIGRISGKVGYQKTLMLCMAGAFVFYLPQGLVQTPWQLLALRVGSGICLGGTMPSVNALIATICEPDRQGATYGLSASISSMGMALGPAVSTAVAIGAGYRAIFFVTTVILAVVGILVGISSRRPGGKEASA